MPPSLCNKCHKGLRQPGDSWCVGCSSLELGQRLLSQGWRNPGLRQVAEEALLSSTRLVKAFHNLDLSLGQGSSGLDRDAARTTAPKIKPQRPPRSRSPTRDTRPPLPRSPRRASGSHADREDREREEKERRKTEVRGQESRKKSGDRRRRHEPKDPPRGHREHHSREKKRKKKKKQRKQGNKSRGGRKHQRHNREISDPLRASHRPLRAEQLTLARSLREGLERRN